MAEYANRALMQNLGDLRSSDFEGAAMPYVPSLERVNSVAPEINQKVRDAQQALAAVALAISGANETIDMPVQIPGIPSEILEYLDRLERNSAPKEKTDYVIEAERRAGRVIDQFDAIDDGTPRRLIQREYREHRSGQAGYNREERTVKQSVLRKVGDVYDFETTTWESSDWRALTNTKSSTDHVYFSRNSNGEFSSAVRARVGTDNAIVSPLLTESSVLIPASVSSESYDLERFMSAYIVQQKAAPIIDLLAELPVNRGARVNRGHLSRDTRYYPVSEYSFGEGDERVEVLVHEELRSKSQVPTFLGFYRGGRHEPEAWVNCSEWNMGVAKDYQRSPKGDTSIIESVHAELYELVVKQRAEA